jgi:hypothetical protein
MVAENPTWGAPRLHGELKAQFLRRLTPYLFAAQPALGPHRVMLFHTQAPWSVFSIFIGNFSDLYHESSFSL